MIAPPKSVYKVRFSAELVLDMITQGKTIDAFKITRGIKSPARILTAYFENNELILLVETEPETIAIACELVKVETADE